MLQHSPLTLLIVQLVVIIGAARLLGLVARRLRQPLVIAEVVAGIVLGPSLLGTVAPEAAQALFPKASLPTLGFLSQLGLMLFMFLVGLELDPKLLRGHTRASVWISHTSIVVPFALGSLLALYLHPILGVPGVPFSSFALFMGAAMSITAFPVLARILSERRLTRTAVGSIGLACAAVDDVTAWCILAFVVSIVRATGIGDALWTTGLAIAYIVAMLWGVRPFLARLGARTTGREGLTQNVVALAFVLLFISAYLTELIGIHALFGSFLLGAIMPRQAGFSQALAEKIEDVVVVVLLPTFFALSGLRTQIGLLDAWDAWLMCALIIAVACLGKFGGTYFAARVAGIGRRDAGALGVLMNTRGLMELIVLNLGLDLGVISPALFTMMVLMALFTTFITTPILHRIYPDGALRRQAADAPSSPAGRPDFTALLCVADPASGPGMVELAKALIGDQGAGDRVIGLQLMAPAQRTSTVMHGTSSASMGPSRLGPTLARGEERGLRVHPLSYVSDAPARDIVTVADAKQASLTVLGWHKPLLGQSVLGGVVREVLGEPHGDTAVLIDRGLGGVRRVLVPYAGTLHDRAALELARRMAGRVGAEVCVLQLDGAEDLRPLVHETPGLHVLARSAGPEGPVEAVLRQVDAGAYDLLIVGATEPWGLSPRRLAVEPEVLVQRCPTSLLVVCAGS